jgi:hypothetical protein
MREREGGYRHVALVFDDLVRRYEGTSPLYLPL